MNKEQTIQHYMKKLGIDHDEAEQMWLEKEMMRADRKKETAPRKRERKPDDDKRLLVSVLHGFLHDFLFASQDHLHCEMTNPEREIEFTFKGNRYRLTLSKPRK